MNERRGHRKLCLCNTKNYERKKYYQKKLLVSIPKDVISVLRVSIPINLLSFRVLLPLSAYTVLPALTLEVLHNRMHQLNTMSEGNVHNCVMLS